MLPRTDLAVEYRDRQPGPLPGVRSETRKLGEMTLERIHISEGAGARALGKPPGRYCTLTLPRDWHRDPSRLEQAQQVLAAQLAPLLPAAGTVLVTGLGNRDITPDALGPFAAGQVIATRHLGQRLPELFSHLRPVCSLSPGVLGTTGMETAEILESLVTRIRPAALLAIDALCAADPQRLCRTVQLCDSGITPGEGTGKARCRLDRESLGIPVIALGMPTVTEGPAGTLVTVSDIDAVITRCARLTAQAVNQVLQPQLPPGELQLLALS